MKATIQKLCEMGWESLTRFKALCKWSKAPVEPETFASPSLRIASATNEAGQEIAFCVLENVLLLRTSVFDPSTTLTEVGRCGDYIDQQVAVHAQRLGISQVMVAVPNDFHDFDDECITMKFYLRKVPAPIAAVGVACSTSAHPQFLN